MWPRFLRGGPAFIPLPNPPTTSSLMWVSPRRGCPPPRLMARSTASAPSVPLYPRSTRPQPRLNSSLRRVRMVGHEGRASSVLRALSVWVLLGFNHILAFVFHAFDFQFFVSSLCAALLTLLLPFPQPRLEEFAAVEVHRDIVFTVLFGESSAVPEAGATYGTGGLRLATGRSFQLRHSGQRAVASYPSTIWRRGTGLRRILCRAACASRCLRCRSPRSAVRTTTTTSRPSEPRSCSSSKTIHVSPEVGPRAPWLGRSPRTNS